MFDISKVSLVDWMGDDKRACHAARTSFMMDGTDSVIEPRDERLIKFLMREKHTSPFEHSVITLCIEAPLPVVAQIMRHRTFSYNQASRRYTSEDIQFIDVAEWRGQAEKNLQCSEGVVEDSNVVDEIYKAHCMKSLALYEVLLEKGVSREQARFVLPQGLMARFWMTGNLHNFLKFLVLRDDEHAQRECRDVAVEIRKILEDLFPLTMQMFTEGRSSK